MRPNLTLIRTEHKPGAPHRGTRANLALTANRAPSPKMLRVARGLLRHEVQEMKSEALMGALRDFRRHVCALGLARVALATCAAESEAQGNNAARRVKKVAADAAVPIAALEALAGWGCETVGAHRSTNGRR